MCRPRHIGGSSESPASVLTHGGEIKWEFNTKQFWPKLFAAFCAKSFENNPVTAFTKIAFIASQPNFGRVAAEEHQTLQTHPDLYYEVTGRFKSFLKDNYATERQKLHARKTQIALKPSQAFRPIVPLVTKPLRKGQIM